MSREWWKDSTPERPQQRTCDACSKDFSERRMRKVVGNEPINGSATVGKEVVHWFCKECHRVVFEVADWDRWPALFTPRAEYRAEMSAWMPARELAEMLGVPGDDATKARSLAAAFRTDGEVMGLQLEWMKPHETSSNRLYRVKPPA